MLYIVGAPNAQLFSGASINNARSTLLDGPAITFGRDSGAKSLNLDHETGHTMDLADLYPIGMSAGRLNYYYVGGRCPGSFEW